MRPTRLASCLSVVLLLILCFPGFTVAATYEVTATSCIGPGSFTDAVAQANANPGLDTIIFRTDVLNVQDDSCGKALALPEDKYMAQATDDLIIDGAGQTIFGGSFYVTPSGGSNFPGTCPSKVTGTTIASNPVGLLRLAAGVSVTVNDLNLDRLRAIADLAAGSDLTLNRMRARRTFDFTGDCDTNAILVRSGGSNLTINDSSFIEAWNDGVVVAGPDGPQLWSNAFIDATTGAGTLNVSGSTFVGFSDIPAIQWNGTANILSSEINDTGGYVNIRGGTAVISNSIMMGSQLGQAPFERLMASGGSTVTLEASTIAVWELGCDTICQGITGSGLIIATDNASIELRASAISVSFDNAEPLIREATGGNVTATTAPNPNWIQPTSGQNATALRSILDQPALLTDAPGLPRVIIGFQFVYQAVTPLLDDGGGSPGLLIDAVTDANTTNVLLSPIDGSPVTEDIFGNPRTEAAGTVRNIGAVQLSLASTVAVSTPSASGAVVSWTRPLDPDPAFPITGYGVIVEPTDGSTPPVRIDVAGADNLSVTLTGLAPNTEYRVTVVAVNANGDGPPSNMPSFTTLAVPPPSANPPQPVPAIPPWALLLLLFSILVLAKRRLARKQEPRIGNKF